MLNRLTQTGILLGSRCQVSPGRPGVPSAYFALGVGGLNATRRIKIPNARIIVRENDEMSTGAPRLRRGRTGYVLKESLLEAAANIGRLLCKN